VADFNAAAIGQQREPSDLETAGTPSKVLVLRNLVPPGAVDESLDEEIGIECSKYGEVTR
jgi:splicing factor 45